MHEKHPVRAIHLFSDRKFLGWVRQTFSTTGWISYYVILNPGTKKSCITIDEHTIEVSTDSYGQQIIIEKLTNMDIAFHYFMDNVKADIICRSHPGMLHCWCFYGAEIYQQTNKFRRDLYGPETRKLLWLLPEIKFRYDLRKFYYIFFRLRQPPINSLLKAIPRIHRILWYVEEEIDKINTRIKLPPWQFFQFFNFSDIIPSGTGFTNKVSRKVLVGNSATIENNHADVLKVLGKITDNTLTYSLPLTYGQFPRYKSKIKALYEKQLGTQVTFLDQHMTLSVYYQFLQEHPTAVFLHNRQQGLGNILYLLYTGTKVYLSVTNVIYHWLQKNRIKVYIFEEHFLKDSQAGNLVLDDETALNNRNEIVNLLQHNRNTETLRALENQVFLNKSTLTE
ncbi:MAG TPA: TDP-N-acetylfucosamine:lipid II N-acetylfucosaminyltransferase [Saprospiraceae bacterium]|nr:TDP-N-acetylfucosamine:lipid II N-acetylfucosaminyltransferase [Saprospiraceae bacterium]